jgi:hypothetical protein
MVVVQAAAELVVNNQLAVSLNNARPATLVDITDAHETEHVPPSQTQTVLWSQLINL